MRVGALVLLALVLLALCVEGPAQSDSHVELEDIVQRMLAATQPHDGVDVDADAEADTWLAIASALEHVRPDLADALMASEDDPMVFLHELTPREAADVATALQVGGGSIGSSTRPWRCRTPCFPFGAVFQRK